MRASLVILGLAVAAVILLPGTQAGDGGPSRTLITLLGQKHGIIVDEGSVHWIDPPGSGAFSDWFVSRAAVVGRTDEDALRDLYLVRVRLAPSGRALAASPTNLTNSFNASDEAFVARGSLLLLGTLTGNGYAALELIDFGGENAELTRSWPLVERLKNSITNYQQTGQWKGIQRTRYELSVPSTSIDMGFEDGVVLASLDAGTIRIRPGTPEPVQGGELAEAVESTKAMTGHVGWIVDTVRAVPMIGKEKIGWLEAKFYNLKDVFMRSFYSIAGEGYAAREIEEDMDLAGEPYVFELPEGMKEMDITWPP
ncbi:MAG: hypothetical protein JRG91_20795, partial [Deltaproteobacteria bacterium]|nr:hypothetical protein [Deltaproteobacteria bacterium]